MRGVATRYCNNESLFNFGAKFKFVDKNRQRRARKKAWHGRLRL